MDMGMREMGNGISKFCGRAFPSIEDDILWIQVKLINKDS